VQRNRRKAPYDSRMKTKHLNGDTGKTALALEKPFWGLMEYLAHEDGYGDWRSWFYANGLHLKDQAEGNISLAIRVRMRIALFLFAGLEEMKMKFDPERRSYEKMKAIANVTTDEGHQLQ